ncbi:pro-FMRFamide-related neuropeptide VF [Xyrichtys novacula]|uniref:Pro-FMRFamide-related neuropeptide VF n=1 Tax=Xyrichtys novacula TaxID=13765 RepID=A0AAV1HGI7_XYRNO|nr:pro-FMRFamide-related neuropeptide VF [Xyrichtys novacula]
MSPGPVLREGVSVNMLITVFLSVLLMQGGLGGAATSELQVLGKSVHRAISLLNGVNGRHTVRTHMHQQAKSDHSRSLDFESFNIHTTPSSKISLPFIVKLYPPTTKPLHLHANMPMRFGRQSGPIDDGGQNSTPNMPQRFGRAWETIYVCSECPKVKEAVNMAPSLFGRSSLFWNLLRTVVNERLLSGDAHWSEDFDFSASSEEVETQGSIL